MKANVDVICFPSRTWSKNRIGVFILSKKRIGDARWEKHLSTDDVPHDAHKYKRNLWFRYTLQNHLNRQQCFVFHIPSSPSSYFWLGMFIEPVSLVNLKLKQQHVELVRLFIIRKRSFFLNALDYVSVKQYCEYERVKHKIGTEWSLDYLACM